VYQNNEMAAILVYGTGISSFLFKYFVLFHHPTGATDHVSENDLLGTVRSLSEFAILCQYSFVVTNFSRVQDNVPDRAIFTDKEIETASRCIYWSIAGLPIIQCMI
jgi:hypothetical protein